ncbi:MAG TPA: hypothetical protein PK198_14220 [Saprospiraceae bacterium]|nr:hypothetical protein [Saprospiraceae bacterium]
MKSFSILICLLACIAGLWVSCEKNIPTQLEFSHYEFSESDANGGTWKPVLLTSASQIGIPAPQSTSSASYLAELADVKAASSQLTAQQRAAVEYWGNNGLLRWNEIARELAAKYNLPPAPNPDGTYGAPDPANPDRYPQFPFAHPPYACRMFAYWSAAQMDALISAWHYKHLYNRPAPYKVDNTIQPHLPVSDLPSYPSDAAVVAAVSEAILGAMFPLEKAYLNQRALEHKNAALWSGSNVWSDVTAGDSLGRAVAAVFLRLHRRHEKCAGTQACFRFISRRCIVVQRHEMGEPRRASPARRHHAIVWSGQTLVRTQCRGSTPATAAGNRLS